MLSSRSRSHHSTEEPLLATHPWLCTLFLFLLKVLNLAREVSLKWKTRTAIWLDIWLASSIALFSSWIMGSDQFGYLMAKLRLRKEGNFKSEKRESKKPRKKRKKLSLLVTLKRQSRWLAAQYESHQKWQLMRKPCWDWWGCQWLKQQVRLKHSARLWREMARYGRLLAKIWTPWRLEHLCFWEDLKMWRSQLLRSGWTRCWKDLIWQWTSS